MNSGFTHQQSIIDKLPAVIFEYTFFTDGSGEFTYISPRSLEILGLDQEILLRDVFPIKQFIHPEDWDSLKPVSKEIVSHRKEWKWEGRVIAKDKTIWVEALGVPTPLEDGRIVLHGVITDISQRKALEQKQDEADKRYRDLVEQIPLAIGIHKKGALVYVNAYAVKLLGATRADDLVGRNVMDFVHPDDKDLAVTRVKKALGGESASVIEEKYIRLDGEIINVEVSSHPFNFENEPAVQVIVKDITHRRKAEKAIKKTESLFSQLFQSSPMAIVLLNEKGTVVQTNKGFEDLFGYTQQELEGNELNQFIVPDALESEGNDLNTLITSYQVIRLETTRIGRDGSHLSVIIYGIPVHQDDATIGIFGMYVDITEQKRLAEELQIRNTELDNFVYKVSHDLRAPLSSIRGLVNLAQLPGNTDNPKDYLKLVGGKIEQLDHFIGDVLSHSKNLKLDLKVGIVDFQKIVEKTFADLSYLDGTGKLQKEITIQGDSFYGDSWRMEEIFRNLVSNAIKYRKLDDTIPRIAISIMTTKKAVEINFGDNGIGIEPINLSKIFEMFYRASLQSDGSGLGLYIVKNAVDKLGGRVTAQSQLGQGTTFMITLPNRYPE
jgi:PAS domain S-box-containing protein